MVLLTIFPYSRPLLSRRVSGRSPNAWLEGSECCHMSRLAAASSKYAEQGDSNHELRALAEGVCGGYTPGQRGEERFPDFSTCLPVCRGVRLNIYFIPLSLQHTHADADSYYLNPWRTSQIAMGHTWLY